MKLRTASGNREIRWAALGAAIAVTLGAGGMGIGLADVGEGDRPVYTAIEPCRLADLRAGGFNVGDRDTPLGTDDSHTFDGWGTVGDCNLPTGTTALSLNVTALDATLPTFVTLYPTGTDRPTASHLNPAPGQPPTPNAVTATLSGSGQFDAYNLQGTVNLVIDVVGVFQHHHHDDRYVTDGEFALGINLARRETITVAAHDLQPVVPSQTYSFSGNGSELWATGTATFFLAPLHMPQGGRIAVLTTFDYDDQFFVGDLEVSIRRLGHGAGAYEEILATTSGYSTTYDPRLLTTDPDDADLVIDNAAYSYWLFVRAVGADWTVVQDGLRFKAAVIEVWPTGEF